ncbi:limbic system-associated membrane protein-like [Onthophagus taurus]|uniref:limbic system-associated membrane protein-like n=1 Tax=Onthophagus taurus TaxID=166361 RepID=UPI000C2005B3|nr:limbic system-associated membrane protein-like [Onthophagus taurus]
MWVNMIFAFIISSILIKGCPGQNLNDMDMPVNERVPNFVTPGQTYRIATGSTVVLPCRITEPGSYVLAWKRGIAVLTAGPVKVTPDPRVSLLPGSSTGNANLPGIPGFSGGSYSLELKHVRPQDAGDYVCQIGTMEPREITHTLEILVPPRIHYVSHTGSLDVLQGATVKMECRASGNPVPTVAWTRKNNVLPSGERTVQGLSLAIQHADRHSAGQYQCSAGNGVGEPDTKHITLNVLYAPEVETERSVVHTGIGLEALLVCIVHAEPSPQVLWFKDTAQLGTTEQHASHARGNRYTLVIRNVTAADFGNYSCVASNVHGKNRGHLSLTGTAGIAAFDSPVISPEKDSYNISWSVSSHAAILEYRLFFRQQSRHRRTHHTPESSNSSFVSYKNDWNSIVLSKTSGINTVLPPYPGVTRQRDFHMLKNLQPGTSYEVRVQAKNAHGWNKISPTFHFTTRSNDIENMVEPSAQPAVYGNKQQGFFPFSSSSTQFQPTTVLLFLILIITSVKCFII